MCSVRRGEVWGEAVAEKGQVDNFFPQRCKQDRGCVFFVSIWTVDLIQD